MTAEKKKLPFHLGMRTVKSALAVGLALFAGYAIKSEYPPFLAIGALGAMQASITESLRETRDLMLGNLVGALLAMAFTVYTPGHLALCAGIGVAVMIVVCNSLHMAPSTTSLACVVFCCCLTDLLSSGDPFYGLLRFRDTVIGTLIALAVNMLIRPYSGAPHTRSDIKAAQQAMLPLLEQRVLRGRIPDLHDLRARINDLDHSVTALLDERMNKSLTKAQVAHLRGCQQLLWKMRDALIGICCIDSMPRPSEENLTRMQALGLTRGDGQPDILDGVCVPEDAVVFNYYLKVFLDANDYLTQLIEL